MSVEGFGQRLERLARACGAPVCVGLDPHLHRLPAPLQARLNGLSGAEYRAAAAQAVWTFCSSAMDAMSGVVPAVKPQAAFFEALGAPGVEVLERVVEHAKARGLMVVLDIKRGDIGSTAEAYAHASLDDSGPTGADSVTLSPYLGPESLGPFARRVTTGKGLFLLVRTSNPGSSAWQCHADPGVASLVADWVRTQNESCDGLGDIGAVIGATIEDQSWRPAMPKAWFLMPGVGAQGAKPGDVVRHARSDGSGVLVTSSRAILFGETPEGDDFARNIHRRASALAADVGQALGYR